MMGTRADFYVGKGKDAEWIGSIAWDGMEVSSEIEDATTEAEYRSAVANFFSDRDDATLPQMGWPWPWDSSDTTDCHYWFFDGKTHEGVPDERGTEFYAPIATRVSCDGDQDALEAAEAARLVGCERIEFPDMTDRKNVTMGARSGIILITG